MSGLACAIPLISALFSACAPQPPFAGGYVEGEYILIAPVATAQITSLRVALGDSVTEGQPLVEMEKRDAEIAVAEAEAALARRQSELANLLEGRRREEIQVIAATLDSARAQLAESERRAERLASLAERGAATEAQRDDSATEADVARARVAQIVADLAVARLPARPHQIAAAEAEVAGAAAARDRAEWNLAERTIKAPATGVIADVLRSAGEIAGPTAPVLSLLPDGAVKLRLYVPEASLALITPGAQLAVRCDGCEPGATATVTYVADTPEFTPPVIYSIETRQKLVYLVEARPDGDARLKPGQIVDVDLAGSGQ